MKNLATNFSSILSKKGVNVYKLRSIKKSSILMLLFVCIFITAVALINYRSSKNTKQSTSNNVSQTDERINKSIAAAYQEDLINFKQTTTTKIASNTKKISEFKESKEYQKASSKNNYKNELAEFEHKNIDLGKRIENYKENGHYKWQVFKAELTNDMDELGRELNSLTKNNVK